MRTIKVGKHLIKISGMSLTGKEKIWYDNKVVSEKTSLTGATHVFDAKEDGEKVSYEVEIGLRWHGA